jgi:hypothetical protein
MEIELHTGHEFLCLAALSLILHLLTQIIPVWNIQPVLDDDYGTP